MKLIVNAHETSSWDNFLKKKKIKTCSTNSLTGERVKFEQGWGERKKKSVWINRDGRNLKGISPLLLAKHRKLYCSDLPLYREIWMTLTSQFAGWETGSFLFFYFFWGGWFPRPHSPLRLFQVKQIRDKFVFNSWALPPRQTIRILQREREVKWTIALTTFCQERAVIVVQVYTPNQLGELDVDKQEWCGLLQRKKKKKKRKKEKLLKEIESYASQKNCPKTDSNTPYSPTPASTPGLDSQKHWA